MHLKNLMQHLLPLELLHNCLKLIVLGWCLIFLYNVNHELIIKLKVLKLYIHWKNFSYCYTNRYGLDPVECARYVSTVKLDGTSLGGLCLTNQEFDCDPKIKYRSLDGSCNNLENPKWGSAYTAYSRLLFPQYADGKIHILITYFPYQPLYLKKFLILLLGYHYSPHFIYNFDPFAVILIRDWHCK